MTGVWPSIGVGRNAICGHREALHELETGLLAARDDERILRAADLGQYLFSRWRKTGPDPDKRPSWLYRSYPEGQLQDAG